MTHLAAAKRCLKDELPDYAAGRLPQAVALIWDRHVAVCDRCRAQVVQEHRLQQALAGVPDLPPGLLNHLLQLGVPTTELTAHEPIGRTFPSFHRGPVDLPRPLPMVSPSAPPQHRSPVRTALVVSLAVGASAAAAWGFAGGGPTLAEPSSPTAVIGQPSPAPGADDGTGTSMLATWYGVGTPTPPAASVRQARADTAESRP
ncbi:MAG: hypothetical protein ACK5MP_13925 [Nostocoides sp.]